MYIDNQIRTRMHRTCPIRTTILSSFAISIIITSCCSSHNTSSFAFAWTATPPSLLQITPSSSSISSHSASFFRNRHSKINSSSVLYSRPNTDTDKDATTKTILERSSRTNEEIKNGTNDKQQQQLTNNNNKDNTNTNPILNAWKSFNGSNTTITTAPSIPPPPPLSTTSTTTTATTTTKTNEQNDLISKLFLGIQPTPTIIAIMSIYFVEGALGLARLAQTFYLKDTLHLGPAELSALTGLFALPWTIKPLYGFLTDGLPLFGYKRRSYLILCGVLGSLSYLFLSSDPASTFTFWNIQLPFTHIQTTISALIVSSACIAFSDVVADGIVVQKTREASNDPAVAGGLQSLCWGSAALGSLLSAYFSGSLLEVLGPTDVFRIASVLPALVALIAFFIDEVPVGEDAVSTTIVDDASTTVDTDADITTIHNANPSNVSDQIQALIQAMRQPAVWKPALFLFLWQSTPTSEGAFLFFMTNDLGMGPEFLGRVRLVTAAASLLGVWGYQQFLRTVSIKNILLWTSIASAPLGLIQLLLISHTNRSLGIPDGAFVFGDDVVLAILGEFAFLPTLVLAAKICPPGVEAVLFATLMSIFNGASTVGTEVGAGLTKYLGVTESNFDNLGLLTIICNVSSLYPLLFIGLLDGVGSKSEAEMEQEEEGVVLDV